ncbi:MAG: hypothetical protein U1D30_05735 [Planctomycetota bacterium]
MTGRSWTNGGFFLMLGVAAGMLLSDLTKTPTVSAAGAADRYEDSCMVTGLSGTNEFDFVWLLDYRGGRLHCIITTREGRLQQQGQPLDLLEQFELPEGSRKKPHFMMVTGRLGTQGIDICYLAEVTTGQLLAIVPPFIGGVRANQNPPPRVVDRITYRPEGEIRNQ